MLNWDIYFVILLLTESLADRELCPQLTSVHLCTLK